MLQEHVHNAGVAVYRSHSHSMVVVHRRICFPCLYKEADYTAIACAARHAYGHRTVKVIVPPGVLQQANDKVHWKLLQPKLFMLKTSTPARYT